MLKAVILCIVVLMIFILWVSWAGAAPFLACDLPGPGVTIAMTEVEIIKGSDGSVTVSGGLALSQGNNFILLDLAGFAVDSYKFRARWSCPQGMWSEWSLFLIAGKPAPAVGLRVVP